MNGFISTKALRFTLITSACLLSGFVSGANFKDISLQELFPKKEISYSKISWISNVFDQNKISLATVDYPASDISIKEIKLEEFHLPRKTLLAKKGKAPRRNLEKLGNIVAKIKSFDLFKDYQNASEKMHQSFILAMNGQSKKVETLVIASSSAAPVVNKPITVKTEKPVQAKKLVVKKMNTQKLSIQIPVVPVKVASAPKKVVSEVKTIQSSAILNTDNERLSHQIENQLLESHVQTYVAKQEAKKVEQLAVNESKPVIEKQNLEDEIDHQNDVTNLINANVPTVSKEQAGCKILPKLHLLKPLHGDEVESSQICPTRQTWISKNWYGEGWVKLEAEGYFPLLNYYPQINSDKALLLDQNSVALLAIKSGIHYTRGMGMILGVLPQGYKIDFSGRAEDVQYFDLNSKKYFILLNVEPGAGVTELVSEKNQNDNTALFTPVLEDTITYLDLAKPVVADIPIKIIKYNEKKGSPNPDIAGLTVGISTQTQVQAITQSDGSTTLKSVRMVPGYPVFVDVSSKYNGERSYQYRYQLNKRTRNGVFVLKQNPEKLIYQWLKQIKTSLSDQSAMVFGQFNRKKLDGFKNHYSIKIDSLTEKYGLTPKNYTILWDEKLSDQDPLEGDRPRFLSVQLPEGLSQANLINESNQIIHTSLIPVSPRVINVISE
jgi:hypothetical protein